MVSAKDILLWTLVIGGTAGAIYYGYSLYEQMLLKQQSTQVNVQQVATAVVPKATPQAVSNPAQPVTVPTNYGGLSYSTDVSPYSTITYGPSLSNPFPLSQFPFDINVIVEWKGTPSLLVGIEPFIIVKDIKWYAFGIYLGSYTKGLPVTIVLPVQTVTIAPYNYVKVPIHVDFINYLPLNGIIEGVGGIFAQLKFVFDITFGFNVLVGGQANVPSGTIYVGSYEEDLTLVYTEQLI